MTISPTLPKRPLYWPQIILELQPLLAEAEVYVVGGTVRDVYLNRPVHDLDLATPGDGRTLARKIANAFQGDYYPLDNARQVGRALIKFQGEAWTVDVAQLRGATLHDDLIDRDFTLNAIAVNLQDLDYLLDPLNGARAIEDKKLILCQLNAIANDPVRALRAIRLSLVFSAKISSDTKDAIRRDGQTITRVSPERLRDEIFKLLNTHKPSAGLMLLDTLGLLPLIFPEAPAMKGLEQSPPHTLDVWRHTLSAMDYLDALLTAMSSERTDSTTSNFGLGMVAFSLSHLRVKLEEHFANQWPNERTHRALMMLAALLHDVAKPVTRSVDPDGRIRFFGHPEEGAAIAAAWAEALRLSNEESQRLQMIVRHHVRPIQLELSGKVTRRALYRFWRDVGQAGVDICLLSLADYLATYGTTLDQDDWLSFVTTVKTLLEGYYLQGGELVDFPTLLDGNALMRHFDLERGPIVGEIINALREAQALKEVQTQDEALRWVAAWLEERGGQDSIL
jgi:putative nucleotidyltransferase with HDIG domain